MQGKVCPVPGHCSVLALLIIHTKNKQDKRKAVVYIQKYTHKKVVGVWHNYNRTYKIVVNYSNYEKLKNSIGECKLDPYYRILVFV